MIDYDTSRMPLGALGWTRLLEAIEAAEPGDENEWVEFKAANNPTSTEGRAAIAKAIVAFANRDPQRAARWFGGHAFIVVGLHPGSLVGVEPVDPAHVHDAVQPFLCDPAPYWEPLPLAYKGKTVLIITIAPPRVGDPIACIAKSSGPIQDGNIYVRRPGKSEPARAADVRRLSERLGAARSTVDIAVQTDGDVSIPTADYVDDWVDHWITAERERLLGPLRPPPAPDGQSQWRHVGAFPDSSRLVADALKLSAANSALMRGLRKEHAESRSEQEYRDEVETYLQRCRDRLPGALPRVLARRATEVTFEVLNNTERNYERLQVRLHAEGDVYGFDHRDRFTGWSSIVGKAPRPWGPYIEDLLPALNRLHTAMPAIPSRNYTPRVGPEIVNGGSTDITFPAIDLRPRDAESLGTVLMVGGPEVGTGVTCSWFATATNVDGRAQGTFTLPVDPERVDISPSLAHEPPRTESGGATIVYPDDF